MTAIPRLLLVSASVAALTFMTTGVSASESFFGDQFEPNLLLAVSYEPVEGYHAGVYRCTAEVVRDSYFSYIEDGVFSGGFEGLFTGATFHRAEFSPTGEFGGGTFTLIGGSEDRNIATGTPLLTATLTDGNWDSNLQIMRFRARVDTVSPAFRALVGPVRSLIIEDYISPLAPGANIFGEDWQDVSWTNSPAVWFSPTALPLNFDELMSTFSLVSSAGRQSSYDHVTDRYMMVADVGTVAQPALLRDYPDNVIQVSDLVGTVYMSALVDDSGTVQESSRQFLWEGGSAALGIPADSTLLSGWPIEAYYQPSQPWFQFLIHVDQVHPQIEAVTGPIKTLVVYDGQAPGAGFDWDFSFSDAAVGFGLGIYGTSESMVNSDHDGDGVPTRSDNCMEVSNGDQLDTDGDGLGTRCDTDLSQDCIVNTVDLGLLKSVFWTHDANADFNGDGWINAQDLAILKLNFFRNYTLENPSAVDNLCDGS